MQLGLTGRLSFGLGCSSYLAWSIGREVGIFQKVANTNKLGGGAIIAYWVKRK